MTEQEAIAVLKRDDDSMRKGYSCINDFIAIEVAIKALEEVEQYRAIGTPEECRAAAEKQKAKKPIEPDEEYGTFKCPNCGGLIFTEDRFETHKHCLLCGQKLDWSDGE